MIDDGTTDYTEAQRIIKRTIADREPFSGLVVRQAHKSLNLEQRLTSAGYRFDERRDYYWHPEGWRPR